MNRVILIILAVALLAIGAGAAFFVGLGPVAGGPDGTDRGTPYPTGTVLDGGSGGSGTADSTSGSTPPFTFSVDAIEECGQTCRDVTVTLRNNDDGQVTGVTVFTRIFAGRDSTDPDDLVWETEVDIGTLEAGGSVTTTERVELSPQEGLMIERQDGWVTILTTVRSDERTVTFKDVEQVA